MMGGHGHLLSRLLPNQHGRVPTPRPEKMVMLLSFSTLDLNDGGSLWAEDRCPTSGKDITVGKCVSTPSPFGRLKNTGGEE